MFEDIFRYIDAEIVDMVYGSAGEAGEIKGNEELMKRAYDLGAELAA
jgi:hypothetical protein